ncbi:MAG TPA: DUF11 domain-containing protein, partial [Anaerolineae bacterium]|nr:DUF11 domain-containing protein [Anaerolineae bacterium]
MRVKLKLLYPFIFAALLAGGLAAGLSRAGLAAAGPLCYVNAAASGAATGDSWADAYPTVQDALADAACAEIWVAKGVYYPDEGAGQTDNAITSTFVLTNGVALYGGFAGMETQRDQRDPAANVTVLSGDIDKNDTTDASGVVTTTANITGTNAYHVVTGSGTDSAAALDGFTITAGQADGTYPNDRGGGIVNIGGSPTLSSLIFSGNAANGGGGMYNSGSPALTNVTFSGNSGLYGGGGVYNDGNSPALTNVTFSTNSSQDGGGMYNNSSPALTNVTFSANSASSRGGGMFNNGNPALTNVTFSGNSAGSSGGGMYNNAGSPALTNTIIANSPSGGDCQGYAVGPSYNNLIADNANACGLTNGIDGNIVGSDPQLGALTDFGGPGRQVFPLLVGSPAIDAAAAAGCPATDQRGAARPANLPGACDIGAYETYSVAITKQVDDASPYPEMQTITFTIIVTNTGIAATGGVISDTLPAGLNFVGPITLDDPTGTGAAGSAPPTLASGLTLGAGDVVTVTFPVTVSTRANLLNTAAVSATQLAAPGTGSVLITPQGLCYVNAAASGAANGLNWGNAYPTVQDALADATCTEIWVAKGVYYPDEGAGQTDNAITSTFALTNGVALYGGFAGTETQRDQRDLIANVTVLSGDIDKNDTTDANGVVTDAANITGTNALHVVTGSGTDNTAILDGFTITAGRSNKDAPDDDGGGVYSWNGRPTLTNLTISGNWAGRGGGLYDIYGAPVLTNVTFSGNFAFYDGGGLFVNTGSAPVLTNVSIIGNSAGAEGGGMYNNTSDSPVLTNVTIAGNTAGNNGGGIYNSSALPVLTNVTISGNAAGYRGGGIYNDMSSIFTLHRVIIANSVGGDCVIGDQNSYIAGESRDNLMQDTGDNACGLDSQNIYAFIGVDPKLGPLTDFGGPGRQLFPLLINSPAIDGSRDNVNCTPTDQRGAPRPVDADLPFKEDVMCDYGTYEIGYNPTLSKQVDNPAPQPGQTITFTLIVANTELTVTNG